MSNGTSIASGSLGYATPGASSSSSSRVGPQALRAKLDPTESGSTVGGNGGVDQVIERGSDRVELSNLSRLARPSGVNSTSGPGGIRTELVNRVRAEIQAGTYDTGEKFDIAVRRAVRDLDVTG